MSEQNNIDEIKAALAAATPGPWSYDDFSDKEFIIYDHTYFNRHIAKIVSDGVESKEREEANAHIIAKAPEYITYLLQEIERLQKEEEFWKQAAENQRENNYELLKKQAILKDALEEIELILTDDTSTQAIEINQVINRAREAL
ncbi:hypothetical protein H8Z60_23835 [Mycolicibacterium fortuitum]|nr:hypothetical protein [Mycolicibacterium fortuitum]